SRSFQVIVAPFGWLAGLVAPRQLRLGNRLRLERVEPSPTPACGRAGSPRGECRVGGLELAAGGFEIVRTLAQRLGVHSLRLAATTARRLLYLACIAAACTRVSAPLRTAQASSKTRAPLRST